MLNKEKLKISFNAIRFPNTVKLSDFYTFTESKGLKKNDFFDNNGKTTIMVGGLDGVITMYNAADIATEIEQKFNAKIDHISIHRQRK